MQVNTQEIIRLIDVVVAPIKMLPLESAYRDGQLAMADMIKRLVKVMESDIGTDIAKSQGV